MGLEASVMCGCYAQGITTPPPFPERFYINDAGFPDLKPAEGADMEADMQRLHDWLRTCCDHPGMEYSAIYLSNVPGYLDFLDALDAVGAEKFPTLHAQLPEEGGALTSPHDAEKALDELAAFRALGEVDTKLFVVDGTTGDRLYAYVPEHGGVFVWDGKHGHNIGVDEYGLFIADAWEHGRVVFRAREMQQELLEPEQIEATGSGRVLFTDTASGKTFECQTPVPGREIAWDDGRMRNGEGRFRLDYPRLLRAEAQRVTSDYYAAVLDPLETIFRASAEMSNPVRWT